MQGLCEVASNTHTHAEGTHTVITSSKSLSGKLKFTTSGLVPVIYHVEKSEKGN